jgi:hypothetical protein
MRPSRCGDLITGQEFTSSGLSDPSAAINAARKMPEQEQILFKLRTAHFRYHSICMPFPIKICAICSEEFELKPDKPGFANRCPACSAPEPTDSIAAGRRTPADTLKTDKEANAARRQAMRDLLYRKDS